MSYFNEVQAALDKRAYSFATGNGFTSQVAWENAPFTPTANTPWMRTTLLPAETEQSIIGTNGLNRIQGVYQIDLFYPANGGSGTARDKADSVISYFKRGTLATYSTTQAVVLKAYRNPAMNEEDWYHIPINIVWYSYVENT